MSNKMLSILTDHRLQITPPGLLPGSFSCTGSGCSWVPPSNDSKSTEAHATHIAELLVAEGFVQLDEAKITTVIEQFLSLYGLPANFYDGGNRAYLEEVAERISSMITERIVEALGGAAAAEAEVATECSCSIICPEDPADGQCTLCPSLDPYAPCPNTGYGCGLTEEMCDCCTEEQRANCRE